MLTVFPVGLGTVRHQTTVETVALNTSLETLTNALATNIHEVTFLEKFADVQLLTNLKSFDILEL